MKIVAIADINEARLKSLGDEYQVSDENCFKSVDEDVVRTEPKVFSFGKIYYLQQILGQDAL